MQPIIRAAGTAAVLVVALLMLPPLARAKYDPWWMQLVFVAGPLLILLAGAAWLFAGGEQGTHLKYRDGRRRLSIRNLNVFAGPLIRFALGGLWRSPLPPPVGSVGPGGPSDLNSLIEGDADLPTEVEVAQKPTELPPDGGRLP
jgi:hypothetical protein